jgi:hypothetical protein
MAKQAASFETADSWAFGRGQRGEGTEEQQGERAKRNCGNRASSLPSREAPVAGADYAQPAVFLDYAQPAVFPAAVDEVPPAERHAWEQLPQERRRGPTVRPQAPRVTGSLPVRQGPG